ncbi:MAG: threonine ammonia-lyase, partial [Actinomycetota bacterium]
MHDPATIGAEQIARAREAGAGHVRNTPVLTSRTIGERCGGEVVLKAENLQRTGSFKLRGALAKLAALGDACRAGVVTASAGNHAQSLAYAARAYGVPCEVFMPSDASTAKTDSAAALGATVNHVEGGFDECLEAAEERARDGGLAFVHAFDDSDVVAGQATL